MNPKTAIRRKAIRYISNRKRCSFAVAAHIIDCMSVKKRLKFYKRFKPEAKE